MKNYGVIEPPKKDGKALKILIVGMLIIIAALSYIFYSTYNEKQNEIAALKNEINEIKSENESLSNKLSSTTTKLNDLHAKYNNQQEEIRSLNKSLSDSQDKINTWQDEAKMWKDKYLGSNTDSTDLQTTFYSTEELVKAIRANPTKYVNQKVTVLGTYYIYKSETTVYDLPNGAPIPTHSPDHFDVADYYYVNLSGIDVIFKNNSTSSVLRTGDYIKITGIEAVEIVGTATNETEPTYTDDTATFSVGLKKPGDKIMYLVFSYKI